MSQRAIYIFLLIISVAALYLVSSGHGIQEMEKQGVALQQAEAHERVEHCKQFIRDRVLDPSAVKWNGHREQETDGKIWVEMDFTAPNQLGGPVRKKWAFSFDQNTGWMEWESGAEESMRQLMREKGWSKD